MKYLYNRGIDQINEMKYVKFKQIMQCEKAKFDLLISLGKWDIKAKGHDETIVIKQDSILHISNKLKKTSCKTKDQNKKGQAS